MDTKEDFGNAVQNLKLLTKERDNLNPKVFDIIHKLESIQHVTTLSEKNELGSEIVEIVTSVSGANLFVLITWLGQHCIQHYLQNLDEVHIGKLLKWLCTCLQIPGEETVITSLTTIGELLKRYPQYSGQYLISIFHPKNTEILKQLDAKNNRNLELIVAIIQCLDIVIGCLPDVQLSELQVNVCEMAAKHIIELYFNDIMYSFLNSHLTSIFLISSLTFLKKISALCALYASARIEQLFGISTTYMQYGVTKDPSVSIPLILYPSQQALFNPSGEFDTLMESRKRSGGKILKTRKLRSVVKATRQQDFLMKQQRTNTEETEKDFGLGIRSESELSDSDNSNERTAKEQSLSSEVRHSAIKLLGVLCRYVQRSLLYGYFYALFPSEKGDLNNTLISMAQRDPNARCRSAALQVASQVLFGSKEYFSQAEYTLERCPVNFLPFSMSLGQMILAIYDTIITILKTEPSLPVLTQALKCLAVLVQATPFHKLPSGFVTEFVTETRILIAHRDSTVQVGALMVLEFLVSTPILTNEIATIIGLPYVNSFTLSSNNNRQSDVTSDLINAEDFEEFIDSEDDYDEDSNRKNYDTLAVISIKSENNEIKEEQSSWLLLHILRNLNGDRQQAKVSVSVYMESLLVLTAMAPYFQLLSFNLKEIVIILEQSLNDPLTDVRLNAARCLESLAYEMARYFFRNTFNTASYKYADFFWQQMLPIIIDLINNSPGQMPAVKICLCSSMSNIGVVLFERLQQGTQMNLFSFLCGVSSDNTEDITVRAAAVRALAVLVLFPSMRENLVFVENTAELTLRLIKYSNLPVRIKAFWSMGNVSDALIANHAMTSCNNKECVSFDLLIRLIEAAINACNDNHKVRCNAVRTLGNLIRLLTEKNFDDYICRNLFKKSIEKFITCIRSSSNAKVKWNSCYAVGNMFRNRALFSATEKHIDLDWQQTLYPNLCFVIAHHSNFKVRINATIAIVHIEERSHFKEFFELIWSSILSAIDNSHNLINFQEYNHRDNLQEQLCLAVCHIINRAFKNDFPMMQKHLSEKSEIVKSTWSRVANRIVPEKGAPLFSCSLLLHERMKSFDQLTVDQTNAILYITNIFAIV